MTTTQGSSTDTSGQPVKHLKMAMLGIGVGGAEMLPAMEAMDEIDLMAGVDVNPVTRERFKARYPEARVYDSVEALCDAPDVEAVWISSPNRFHAEHTIYAANHGKHVVVEKPMALSLEQAEAMVRAAEQNSVKLLATLEVCLAIMQSARERREVPLSHQVAVPENYDADLPVPYLDRS